MAQEATFDSLFKEYSLKDKCTTLNISNAMFQSMNVKIDANYMQVISVENKAIILKQFLKSEQNVISSLNHVATIATVAGSFAPQGFSGRFILLLKV